MTFSTNIGPLWSVSSIESKYGGFHMQAISGEELAVDRKARMKLPFEEVEARPVTDRILDFEPTFEPLTPEEARRAQQLHRDRTRCRIQVPGSRLDGDPTALLLPALPGLCGPGHRLGGHREPLGHELDG